RNGKGARRTDQSWVREALKILFCAQRGLNARTLAQAIDVPDCWHLSRAHHAVARYRRFPESLQMPRIGGVAAADSVSTRTHLYLGRDFGVLSLPPKIPFPGKRRPSQAETRFELA